VFRHLLWDMGGTMFDTYPQVDAMFAQIVREHGQTVSDMEVSRLTRISTGEAMRHLAHQFKIPIADFLRAEAALKTRWRTDPPPTMPGLSEVMDALSGKNLVVTHRDRASATALLNAREILVDDLICPDDGFARKPDPQMYLELIRRHDLAPEECLGIGDRPLDAHGAHGAGITAAMLITPDLPMPSGPAEFTITGLTELLTVVE